MSEEVTNLNAPTLLSPHLAALVRPQGPSSGLGLAAPIGGPGHEHGMASQTAAAAAAAAAAAVACAARCSGRAADQA